MEHLLCATVKGPYAKFKSVQKLKYRVLILREEKEKL